MIKRLCVTVVAAVLVMIVVPGFAVAGILDDLDDLVDIGDVIDLEDSVNDNLTGDWLNDWTILS